MGLEEILSASITPKIPIILASGSQSRKQMLEEAGICFEIIKTDTDEDALKAYQLVTKLEKIRPSLEPCHAFAEAIKIAPKLSKDTILICNSCGDSLKDKDILKARLGKTK